MITLLVGIGGLFLYSGKNSYDNAHALKSARHLTADESLATVPDNTTIYVTAHIISEPQNKYGLYYYQYQRLVRSIGYKRGARTQWRTIDSEKHTIIAHTQNTTTTIEGQTAKLFSTSEKKNNQDYRILGFSTNDTIQVLGVLTRATSSTEPTIHALMICGDTVDTCQKLSAFNWWLLVGSFISFGSAWFVWTLNKKDKEKHVV